MANHKSGAQRYNDRMSKLMDNARRLEQERLERGEEPNPSLTSPEDARKYGWEIVGRQVTRVSKQFAGMHGKYEITETSCSAIIDDPSTSKVRDGDTRTIKYVSGPLEGYVIDQEFGGSPQTGGWFDVE